MLSFLAPASRTTAWRREWRRVSRLTWAWQAWPNPPALTAWPPAADRAGLVPLSRLRTADEIAKAVVFLASDDASYVTGAELFVDGGFAEVSRTGT